MPPENVGRERATLEESLGKLGVDFVDLWLVHWPPNRQATPTAWKSSSGPARMGCLDRLG
jgi:diketogulonate reductase-like aldo/keto reductase